MSLSVFEFHSYKKFIIHYVQSEGEPWGYWNKIAKAISCQPAYLSNSVKGNSHLTIDHIVALAQFWSLPSLDEDYLITIFEAEKAGSESIKKHLFQKAKLIKQRHENLKDRIKKESLESIEQQALYYSHWLWMAVHFLTSIHKYQNIKSMSSRLLIPEAQLLTTLEQLKAMDLIEKAGSSWKWKTGEFHLGKESPLATTHHANWRGRAVLDSQSLLSDGVHYSAVYAMSESDFEKLKTELLKMIDHTRRVVISSPEEEIYNFNCDLFKI